MQKVRLVALVSGTTKEGNKWYKVLFKTKNSKGNIVMKEFFVQQDVAQNMIENEVIEDVDVCVEFKLDDYLRPSIAKIVSDEDSEEDL
jgi:hypothetical protein